MTPHKNQAIQTALTGNWELAISINEELLKENPQDIETLNRLAFAYTVSGKTKDAKITYQKVLEIDIFNPIAIKNLKRLGDFSPGKTINGFQLGTDMFLEESGKTKIVILINTAQPKLLKSLQVGQQLHLAVKRSKIFVLDNRDQYIGMLPDDIGKRIIKFLNGGNIYETYVKSIEEHSLAIFIKEKKRAGKFKNLPTFTSGEKSNLTFAKSAKPKNYSPEASKDEDA